MNSQEEFHTARSQEMTDLRQSPVMEQPGENSTGLSSSLDARAEVPTEKSVVERDSFATQTADARTEGVAVEADDDILKLAREDVEGKEFDDADDVFPTEEAEVPQERMEEVRAREVQQEQPTLTPLEIAGEVEHAEKIDDTLELMLDLEQMEWKGPVGPVELVERAACAAKPGAAGEHIADAEEFPMAAAAAEMAAGMPDVAAASAEKVTSASDAAGSSAETEVGEPNVSVASAGSAAGAYTVQDVTVMSVDAAAGLTDVCAASAGRPADSSKSAALPGKAVPEPGVARFREREDYSSCSAAKRPRLEPESPPTTSAATTAQDDGKDPGKELVREAVAWLLRQILQQFNAPRVKEVPALLRKYEHHEREILEVALEKYIGGGPNPPGGNTLAECEQTKVLEELFAGLGRELLAKPYELRPPSTGEGSLPSFLSQLYELLSHARTMRIQDHARRRKLQPQKPVPAREKTVPPGFGTDSRIASSFSLRLSLQMAKQKAAGSHAAQSPPAPSQASASAASSERGSAEAEAQLGHEPRILQLPQELRKLEQQDWRKLRDAWAQKFKQLWSSSPQGQSTLAVLPEPEKPEEHRHADKARPSMAFEDVESFLERFE